MQTDRGLPGDAVVPGLGYSSNLGEGERLVPAAGEGFGPSAGEGLVPGAMEDGPPTGAAGTPGQRPHVV